MIAHHVLARACAAEYGLGSYTDIAFKVLDTVSQSDDQCTVAEHEGSLVVVFRGTESQGDQIRADWAANMRFFRWYDPRVGWGHKGFLRGAQALYPHIEAIVRGSGKPIVLTGHSRGGGLAVMVGCMLVDAGYDLEIVTFGAPRVTMEGARKRLWETPVVQYAHTRDPVTKMMPRIKWLWPYRHINRIWKPGVGRALAQHKIVRYINTVMHET